MDKVLLLEDEPLLRAALSRTLQQSGEIEVIGAGSLREAISALDFAVPKLLIADLDLPDGSGLDLLPELAVRGLRLPVVIISAHLTRYQAELPESTNIEALAKPFEISRLVSIVKTRLARSKTEPPPAAFAVADYLQLAGMARRSVLLSLRDEQGLVGEIIVQEGEPRWARDKQGEGEAAFRRLALLQQVQVSCKPLTAKIAKSNLSGSLEHLLIDAARHADEAQQSEQQVTKVPRPTEVSSRSSGEIPVPPSARAEGAGRSLQPGTPPPLPSRAKPRLPPVPPRPAGAPAPVIPDPTLVALPKSIASSSTEENTVSPNRSSPSAQQLLTSDHTLKAITRADRHGSVVDAAGEGDLESCAAVATIAAKSVLEAAAELGFGRPTAWQLSLGSSSWYVAHDRDELVIGHGGLNKNPGVTLRKLAKNCGALP
ncbi:MAG TPA: response regulator [Polyangiaceae bacterium]|jgi:DNA-binding response OmpR family regulator|nr:response regulator [Polyangiaceae bacterium]